VNPELVATIVWLVLASGIVVGFIAIRTRDRNVSWVTGIVATMLLVAFSWAAGFSIGPFTIALPVLLTATITSRGAPVVVRILFIAAAAVVYWLVTWKFQQSGYWPLVLPGLCASAYLGAILLQRHRTHRLRN